jgi:hypothetical protein
VVKAGDQDYLSNVTCKPGPSAGVGEARTGKIRGPPMMVVELFGHLFVWFKGSAGSDNGAELEGPKIGNPGGLID